MHTVFHFMQCFFFYSCLEFADNQTVSGGCKWDYTGQGFDCTKVNPIDEALKSP